MSKIKEYFGIEELVDKTVFDKYGEVAWKFMDELLLDCLLIIREELGKPMTINNWKWGWSVLTKRTETQHESNGKEEKLHVLISSHVW